MSVEYLPTVQIPKGREALETSISDAYTQYVGATALVERSGGYSADALNQKCQAEANMNELLDHWPLCMRRNEQPLLLLSEVTQ